MPTLGPDNRRDEGLEKPRGREKLSYEVEVPAVMIPADLYVRANEMGNRISYSAPWHATYLPDGSWYLRAPNGVCFHAPSVSDVSRNILHHLSTSTEKSDVATEILSTPDVQFELSMTRGRVSGSVGERRSAPPRSSNVDGTGSRGDYSTSGRGGGH